MHFDGTLQWTLNNKCTMQKPVLATGLSNGISNTVRYVYQQCCQTAPPRPLTHPLETLHPTPLVPIATYTPHFLDPPHSLDPHTLEPPHLGSFGHYFMRMTTQSYRIPFDRQIICSWAFTFAKCEQTILAEIRL